MKTPSEADDVAGANQKGLSPETQAALDRNESQRLAERRQASQANGKLAFATDQEEATRRFLETRSSDPFPSITPALLNSADIADYVLETGMIVPFRPDKLKTASYEVALLGEWIYVDRKGQVQRGDLKEGDEFKLRKNSIAFMTAEPLFQLPDYIALRHNLKISHVYKGLLVGTGPLIDPGFTGKISLPIHNLTQNDYVLKGGEGIIWVEFTKLSENPTWRHGPRSADHERRGRYRAFPPFKSRDSAVTDYINDAVQHLEVPSSSSAKIAETAKKARRLSRRTEDKVVRNTRYLTLAGAIAIVGLAASLIGPVVVDLRSQADDQRQQIKDLQGEVDKLQTGMPSPSATLRTTPSPGQTP